MNDITIEWQGQVVEVTATLVIGGGGEVVNNTFENLEANGNLELDLSLYARVLLNLTGNAVISFINVPDVGLSKQISVTIQNDIQAEVTLPTATEINLNYDKTAAFQQLDFNLSNYTTEGLKINCINHILNAVVNPDITIPNTPTIINIA